MRTLLTLATLATALAIVPGLSAGGGAEEKVLVVSIQDMNLTDAQETKIADIRKDHQPKVQAAAKELVSVVKEEVDKIRNTLTDEQKTKLAEMKEERRERVGERLTERIAHLDELGLTDAEHTKILAIREEYHPKIVKAVDSLKGLLTADQLKARDEALKAGKTRREVCMALELNDEQKAKFETLGNELRTLVRQELENIQEVLTEAQKQKLQEFAEERKEQVRDRMAHAISNFRDLNLTAEQKSQIAEIRKEYRPKVHEAGNKFRAAVRDEMEAILLSLKG